MPLKLAQRDLNLISFMILVAGIVVTIMQYTGRLGPSLYALVLNMILYLVAFYVLYLGQRFRYFTVYPRRVLVPDSEETQRSYFIQPWLPGEGVKWRCEVYEFHLTIRAPLIPERIDVDNLIVMGQSELNECINRGVIEGDDYVIKCIFRNNKYQFNFKLKTPIEADQNTRITITVNRGKSQEYALENPPYIEYNIVYKTPGSLFIHFKDGTIIY